VSELHPITCMIIIVIASFYNFLPRIPHKDLELILDYDDLEYLPIIHKIEHYVIICTHSCSA